jgi:hypothetical protein
MAWFCLFDWSITPEVLLQNNCASEMDDWSFASWMWATLKFLNKIGTTCITQHQIRVKIQTVKIGVESHELGIRFFHYRHQAHAAAAAFAWSNGAVTRRLASGGGEEAGSRRSVATTRCKSRARQKRRGKESAARRRQRFREMQLPGWSFSGWEYSFSGSVQSVLYVSTEEPTGGALELVRWADVSES